MAPEWLGIAEDITVEGVVGESHPGRFPPQPNGAADTRSGRAWLKPGVGLMVLIIVLISWLPTASTKSGSPAQAVPASAHPSPPSVKPVVKPPTANSTTPAGRGSRHNKAAPATAPQFEK